MLNISKIPFSYQGSYFVVSEIDSSLYIRDIRNGDSELGKIFQVIPTDLQGNPIQYSIQMLEYLLCVYNQSGNIILQFCFADEDTLCLKVGRDFNISIEAILGKYDHVNPLDIHGKQYELHSYSQNIKMMLQVREGQVTAKLPWDKVENLSATLLAKQNTELTLESYSVLPKNKEYLAFETYVEESKKRYSHFKKASLSIPEDFQDQKNAASYILYSCGVKPEGIIKKRAIYMSNNYMTNIWSWDHAFTSLCFAKKQPEIAYEQFMFFKDFQDPSGVFPDYANNQYSSFSCCKPPIHGIIYKILIQENEYFTNKNRLEEVHEMLINLINYWENYRRRQDLYYYNHGNDSGWDNASLFSSAPPLITADIAAYMITMYDAMITISELLLEKSSVISTYKKKIKKITDRLIQELWNGNRFVAKKFDGTIVDAPFCLLRLMPIVAWRYLPPNMISNLLRDLQNKHQFTEHGFATERVDSPHYKTNGYWRGPIWAPSSFLIINALLDLGELEFAYTAIDRFSRLCQIGGFSENFDAVTGAGQDDSAFSWTSSVFLYLANKLTKNSKNYE